MKPSEEAEKGVCQVIEKLDRPWKNYKQEAPFHGSLSKLKGHHTQGQKEKQITGSETNAVQWHILVLGEK